VKSKYLSRDQKPYDEKLINNILLEAEMDTFHRNLVKINEMSKLSSNDASIPTPFC
jgi:hypothetical protein